MAIRERLINKIVTCFKRHGAVTIETPLFELKETLTGKYGEDSKLIYDLADQGGELCSLRYDLTVPFARYVAMNRVKQIKRYQIGRVYRRDNPVMTKGRYREFYQCDFDIAGEYDTMVPDAEAVRLIVEILDSVNVGKYIIKVNHRKFLDGMFEICGVPEEKFRTISSAVDKLDKTPWDEVRKEMVDQKGLPGEVADRIQKFVELKGEPLSLLSKLLEEKKCENNKNATVALQEMQLLFKYLECYGVLDKVSFDLSLARGLDYYTGIIYEGILIDGREVGSICGGGRYDGLVGIFGGNVPAVGFSIGIERIFSIIEHQIEKSKQPVRVTETDVFVASIDKGLAEERMKILAKLWDAGIKAEQIPRLNPKVQAQHNYANTNTIPFTIIFGKSELADGTLKLKNMTTAEQISVKRDELVAVVKEKLKEYYSNNTHDSVTNSSSSTNNNNNNSNTKNEA